MNDNYIKTACPRCERVQTDKLGGVCSGIHARSCRPVIDDLDEVLHNAGLMETVVRIVGEA